MSVKVRNPTQARDHPVQQSIKDVKRHCISHVFKSL
jgi:hypothetical protein